MQAEIAQTRLEQAREQRKAADDPAEFTRARARERFWEGKLEEITADSGGKPKSQRDCKMPHSELSKKGKLKCPGCGANIGQVEKKVEEAVLLEANTLAKFDPDKHPRGRGGKFADVLGKLAPGSGVAVRGGPIVAKNPAGGFRAMEPHGVFALHGRDAEGYAKPPSLGSVMRTKDFASAAEAAKATLPKAAAPKRRRPKEAEVLGRKVQVVKGADDGVDRSTPHRAYVSSHLPSLSDSHARIQQYKAAPLSDRLRYENARGEALVATDTPNFEEKAKAAHAALDKVLTGVHTGKRRVREAADSMAKASTPEPFSTSKTSNWVAKGGGLPAYIQHIAHDIHEKRGKSVSNAIQIAIGVVKRWAKGVGNVDAGTRAAAAKAVGEWEKLKAGAHAKSLAAAVIEEAAQQGVCANCKKKLKRPNQADGGLILPEEQGYEPSGTCAGCGFTTAVLAAMVEDEEATLVDAEAAALVEALSDLDEVAVWDPEKHPRQRGGRFADVLGKLSHRYRGELSRRIAGFQQRSEIMQRGGNHAEATKAKRQADSLRVHLRNMGPTQSDRHPGYDPIGYQARARDAGLRAVGVAPTDKIKARRALAERHPAPRTRGRLDKTPPRVARTDGKGKRTDERTSVEPTPGETKNAIRKAWDMHPGIDYSLVSRLLRKHKSNLTRAKNSGDHQKVIDVADAALADFEAHGYPDDWARFERARLDAQFAQRRDADYHPGFGDTEDDQLQRQIDSGQRGKVRRRTEPDVSPADLPGPEPAAPATARTISDSRPSEPSVPSAEELRAAPIDQLARHIEQDWGKQGKGVNYAARPYLAAMHSLRDINDSYGLDDARSVLAYFVSNASSWRGPKAKAIKAEIRRRLKR